MEVVAYEVMTGYKLEEQRDNWRSLCPAHSESTPSFFIHKKTYLCHCFGCGVKGRLDTVLAKALELQPREIRESLDLPLLSEPFPAKEPNPFSKSWLAGFKRISMHPALKRRGFKSDIVLLHRARWDPEGRIVFPLQSLGGLTVGALGRSVKPSITPKWYSYWGVRKGDILYQAIDTLNVSIIVEGIFDVMWLNQYGYTGAAALLTSSPSRRQLELIKENTDEVLLFLDNDEAGRIGQETLATALKSSIKVNFAVYPEGKNDPQELTPDELHSVIENKQTYVEYTSSKR